jgi:hypothetical protein
MLLALLLKESRVIYYFGVKGTLLMNGERKSPKKLETGKPVFGNDVDDVLTKKIMGHSTGTGDAPALSTRNSGKESASSASPLAYRTPEDKRAAKRTGYGVAALVCLVLLGAITYLWARFRSE